MTADNLAEQDVRLSQEEMVRVLGCAIEVGRELEGIARFGYPTLKVGSNRSLEGAVDGLRPYLQALKQALEPALKQFGEKPWVRNWVTRTVQSGPKQAEPK